MAVLNANKPHQKYFENICAIPHPSCEEQALSNYVMSVAKSLNLECYQDDLWNVIVKKPASSGYESSPAVMLQAHMDMVCVKEPGSNHNFSKDPLSLYIDDLGNIRARGTTLGADDGYGVAYLLALMEENNYSHPPLELVFTVQEENGCNGVEFLDCSKLKSRRMIGLDVMGSDIEYTSCVACFSSDKMTVSANYRIDLPEVQAVKLTVSGIQPVRRGVLVHPELHNAIKIMGRILNAVSMAGNEISLSTLSGGEAENYNPVICEAVFSAKDVNRIKEIANSEFELIKKELDDGMQTPVLGFEVVNAANVISAADSQKIIDLIYLMPSATIEADVLTDEMTATNNVGMISLNDGSFSLIMSDRAKNHSHKSGILNRVKSLCRILGMELSVSERYTSWPYNPNSFMLNKTAELMKKTYGHEMVDFICPGGLECCTLIPNMPGLDIVMFAPIGDKCHSTEEFMNLASFDRVYDFVKVLLSQLK